MSGADLKLMAEQVLPEDMPGRRRSQEILRPDHALQGLTAQQEQFALRLFEGLNQVEAYRLAYDCSASNPKTIWRHAHDLAKHPKVVARVRQLQAERSERSSLAYEISRETIANGIADIAFDKRAKHSDRLRGLELLGKIGGIDLFKTGGDNGSTDDMSIEEIERRLAERLNRLKDVTPDK